MQSSISSQALLRVHRTVIVRNMHENVFFSFKGQRIDSGNCNRIFYWFSIRIKKSFLQEICDLKAVVNARSQVAAETKNWKWGRFVASGSQRKGKMISIFRIFGWLIFSDFRQRNRILFCQFAPCALCSFPSLPNICSVEFLSYCGNLDQTGGKFAANQRRIWPILPLNSPRD